MESIFTCAKAVEHKVAGCIARMDRRAFLPLLEIDFNRIDQTGLPVRAQRVDNVSMLQPEASGTDRRIAAMQYYVSRSGDEQIKIGHRSNYAHDPFRSSARGILLIRRQTTAQRELLLPLAHCVPEAPDVTLVLETDDKVVSGAPRKAVSLVLRSSTPTDSAPAR